MDEIEEEGNVEGGGSERESDDEEGLRAGAEVSLPSPLRAASQKRGVAPKFQLGDASEGEVFCCRFSPDDLYLAAASGGGSIMIYNALTGKRAFVLKGAQEDRLPTTQVRWRPQQALSKTKNVLVSVAADGRVLHWHASSGKCLHEIVEPDNQLFCVDYVADGALFATAGRRREVRVYDECTKKLAAVLAGGEEGRTPGHSNRVFSMKFHPTMRSVLVTGGWDNTVQFWDLRRGHAVRAIFGPHVCGDSIDISEDGSTILTGSWRIDRQLQLWDFRTERLMDTLHWRSGASLAQPCMVYAAQFSKGDGSKLIAAGGSGANEAKIFDRRGGGIVGNILGLTRACYSVDFSNSGSMLAVAGGDGCIRVVNVNAQ